MASRVAELTPARRRGLDALAQVDEAWVSNYTGVLDTEKFGTLAWVHRTVAEALTAAGLAELRDGDTRIRITRRGQEVADEKDE